MTYKDKLLHPKWQKKRLEVMNRDNFICTCCGNESKSLQVHHDKYEGSNPWDTRIEYLRTVCYKCHSILEFMKKNIFISNTTVSLDIIVKYATENFCVANFSFKNSITDIVENHSICLSFNSHIEILLLTDREHWNRISQGIKIESNG